MTIFYGVKQKLVAVIMCAILLFGVFLRKENYYSEESLSMYSGSYALLDAETGRVLKGKEEDSPMANASTTKILTCIITLENCELDERVSVSSNAASQPKVRWGIQEGETYSLKELLYGLMLESYNDCAVAIAEHVAGSTEKFAEMMNKKAEKIGCVDTYFITPNGLDEENENGYHHSTATDLCKIMAYCTWESPKKDLFLEITQTRNYEEFINRNAFLNQMEGVLSGKTGFTNKAGYCYVAALEMGGEKYCIALLACGWPNNKTYKWKDAKQLFEYGLETYTQKKVKLDENELKLKVDGFLGKPLFYEVNQEVSLQLEVLMQKEQYLMSDDEKMYMEIFLNENHELPIKKGQKLGFGTLYIEDEKIDEITLVASQDVYIWGWKTIAYTIFYQFLTFCSLFH